MKLILFILLFISFISLIFLPLVSHAQATLVPDTEVFEKAQVLEVTNQGTTTIVGTDTTTPTQTLKIKVRE